MIITKTFSELNTEELYQILRLRSEVFVVEQDCVYQDIDNKDQKTKRKNILISETIDHINSRFGRDSVTIGALPKEMFQFSGTKVAFTRIPEIKEFYE